MSGSKVVEYPVGLACAEIWPGTLSADGSQEIEALVEELVSDNRNRLLALWNASDASKKTVVQVVVILGHVRSLGILPAVIEVEASPQSSPDVPHIAFRTSHTTLHTALHVPPF